MTQLLGRSMSNKKAAGNGAGRRGNKNFDGQMPSDDEVDAFHKSKDRLALNVSDDDDESESDDDGSHDLEDGGDLLGLSDDDDDDESDDDDDDEDGDGRLAQREFCFVLHVEIEV